MRFVWGDGRPTTRAMVRKRRSAPIALPAMPKWLAWSIIALFAQTSLTKAQVVQAQIGPAQAALGQTSAPAVEMIRYPRIDGAVVEARVYPAPPGACPPLAVISHGFGGDFHANAPLAEALTKVGFRVVAPHHVESGPQIIRALYSREAPSPKLRPPIDPRLLGLRLDDISAVLAREIAPCRPPFLLMAGHSMGAHTVLIEAGAKNSARLVGQDRFDAYIAISSLGEGSDMLPTGAVAGLQKPVLLITGTRDQAVNGPYETRLSTFFGLPPGRKRLAIIDPADHIELGGRPGSNVGHIVGAIAADFVHDLYPGPWKRAEARPGVSVREK